MRRGEEPGNEASVSIDTVITYPLIVGTNFTSKSLLGSYIYFGRILLFFVQNLLRLPMKLNSLMVMGRVLHSLSPVSL